MTRPAPSPGWYPDGQGSIRWFDGNAWTQQIQPDAPAAALAPSTYEPVHRQYVPPPGPAPAARSGRTGLIVVMTLLAVVLLACGGVAAYLVVSHHSQSQNNSGFNNPDTLAADIQQISNHRAGDPSSPYYDPSVTVKSVTCIAEGAPHQFTCIATLSNGINTTTTAVVAADGNSYITR